MAILTIVASVQTPTLKLFPEYGAANHGAPMKFCDVGPLKRQFCHYRRTDHNKFVLRCEQRRLHTQFQQQQQQQPQHHTQLIADTPCPHSTSHCLTVRKHHLVKTLVHLAC